MKKYSLGILLLITFMACGPRKVIESTYKNGNPKVIKYYEKVDGKDQLVKEVVFYENKNRKMEGSYSGEKRSGTWTAWYENGKVWSEGSYLDGKRNGPGMVYHENGKKYIESVYANDEKTGKWRFYDTAGNVIKEVNFDLMKADSIAGKK
ncbi:MAG: hypothetical protein IPH84_15700 [Bacteroidales bacterium]|nr:hypothetical protein [Bacteroidales bacterium]